MKIIQMLERLKPYCLLMTDYGLYRLYLHTVAVNVEVWPYTVIKTFHGNLYSIKHDQSCGISKSAI
jgi:hypothetical protein